MHSKLKRILDVKREEVAELKKRGLRSLSDRKDLKKGDFSGAISREKGISIIAEIKFASPSAGMIRESVDPVRIGRIYERAGAAAISFLTDRVFFKGELKHLPRLKKALALPILRKDFIIDEIQLEESLCFGADAVLLIARILPRARLQTLIASCRAYGLEALTEVHDRADLEKALDCGATIIGINNRDLDTFKVDIDTTFKIAPLVPRDRILVCESGIRDGKDIESLKGSGVKAALVGSALMGSKDLEQKTLEMVKAGG